MSTADNSIHSSRLWALLTLRVTQFLFPDRLAIESDTSIFARKIGFWLTPWMRDENHMQIAQIAEIEHERGLVWDRLSIESTGGLSPIVIAGLPKGAASRFVTQARGLMRDARRPAR